MESFDISIEAETSFALFHLFIFLCEKGGMGFEFISIAVLTAGHEMCGYEWNMFFCMSSNKLSHIISYFSPA